jgi:hypothetical protein
MTDAQFIEYQEKMLAEMRRAHNQYNKELRKLCDTLDTVIHSQASIYETLTEVKGLMTEVETPRSKEFYKIIEERK